MSRITSVALALLTAGSLSACGPGVVDTAFTGTFDQTMLNYVASRGDLYTEVHGNPFGVPQEDLESAITGTMYGSHSGPPVRFNTQRDPDNTSPYRVVVMLDPARGVTPGGLCATPNPASAAATGTVRVIMAFCARGTRETSVTGRVAGASDPNDPDFRAVIRQMTTQMFPRRNPNTTSGGVDFNT